MSARSFLSRLVLALTLLLFQQGALAHALEHAGEQGHPHSSAHDCQLCHAYGAAGHGMAANVAVCPAQFLSHTPLVVRFTLFTHRAPLIAGARAPPLPL